MTANALELKLQEMKARVRPGRTMQASEGLVLNDRWQSTGKLLGSGKWGIVYLGKDLETGELVAIKRTKDHVSEEMEKTRGAERVFADEVRALRSLDHPNIVHIYDSFEQAIDPMAPDLPYHFIVMELLAGRTSEEIIEGLKVRSATDIRVYSPDQMTQFVSLVAAGLSYAQRQGKLVHRDLHPANIIDVPGRGPVILDMGLAKALEGDIHTELKRSIKADEREIIRSEYIDPQVSNGLPTLSSDLYSLVRIAAAVRRGEHVKGCLQPDDFKHPNGAIAELFAKNASFNPYDRSEDASAFLEELVTASHARVVVLSSEIAASNEHYVPMREGTISQKVNHFGEWLFNSRKKNKDDYVTGTPNDHVQKTAYAMDWLHAEADEGNSVAKRILADESLESIARKFRRNSWQRHFSKKASAEHKATLAGLQKIVDTKNLTSPSYTLGRLFFSSFMGGMLGAAAAAGGYYLAGPVMAAGFGIAGFAAIDRIVKSTVEDDLYDTVRSFDCMMAAGRQVSYANSLKEQTDEFGPEDTVALQLRQGRTLQRITDDFYALRGSLFLGLPASTTAEVREGLAKGFENMGLPKSKFVYDFYMTHLQEWKAAACTIPVTAATFAFSWTEPGSLAEKIVISTMMALFTAEVTPFVYAAYRHAANHRIFKRAVRKLSPQLETEIEPTMILPSYGVASRPFEPAGLLESETSD